MLITCLTLEELFGLGGGPALRVEGSWTRMPEWGDGPHLDFGSWPSTGSC